VSFSLLEPAIRLSELAARHLVLPRIATVGAALIALVVSLALIFAGRFVIRVIAFLAVGIAFASVAATFGAAILGVVGFVLGGIVGFFIGGVLSFFLLPLAIGIGAGVIAYDLSQMFLHAYAVSVVLGIIFFIIGLIVSMKLLALAAVIFGGLLLLDVLYYFHFPPLLALLVAILMCVIGFWVQDGFESKGRQGYKFATWSKNAPPASAVPVAPPTSGVRYCAYCGSRIDNPSAVFCPNCGASLGN
jgi:hypothetical protein